MTRFELTIALGGAVVAAAAVGWVLHAAWSRIAHGPRSNPEKLAELSKALAEAEDSRDALSERAADVERDLTARLAETEERLSRELSERQAELEATMETVGELRRQLSEARGPD